MADVTYLRHHEPDDDPHLPDQTLTFDSLPYFSHHDFDFYASDPEFSPPHRSLRNADSSQPFQPTIRIRSEDGFSGSIPCTDLLDRENQVNFVMDLFQQRVEQSQVMGHTDLVSEVLNDSGFCDCDLGRDVLGLGLGFGAESDSLQGDDNCGFMVENYGSGGGGDEDDFFIERRVSGSESGEAPSTALVGFGSDFDDDEEENGDLGDDGYNNENDDVASIPLRWDSLQFEDNTNRDNNEDFEWEEVDGRVDEREVLSVLTGEDDRSLSVSVSPIFGIEEEEEEEEEESVVRVEDLENLEWQVLLNANNLNLEHDAEPYLGDHDDYIYTAEYEMMFGQFAENENLLIGRPPASISVVQNLPSVLVTKQDMDDNKALCAVCKDDFVVGEQARQLPCSHRYHGDCILPWLAIRNTCPVCRYEFPTDDADYERRRAQRSGPRL